METWETIEIKRRFRQAGLIGLSLICALIITGLLLGLISLRDVKPAQAKSNNAPTAIDLSITKSHSGNFKTGTPGVYTITVKNVGDETIPTGTSVTVIDDIPSEFTSPSTFGTDPNWSISFTGNKLIGVYNISTELPSTNSLPPIIINVTVPSESKIITNTASLETTISEENISNNSASDPTIINPVDLVVSKSYSAPSLLIGEPVTFTVVVTNNGPGTTTNVKLIDLLPTSTTFFTYSLSSSPSGQTYSSTTGLWTIGTLAEDGSATLTLTAKIKTDSAGITIVNTASGLTSDNPDSNTSNNTDSVSFVAIAPDLQIFKTDNRTTISPSDRFTYTIYITNAGTAAASGIIITDVLPSHLAYVTDTLGITKISLGSNTYRWNYPNTINAGSSINFKLGVQAAAAMPVSSQTNTVSVSTNTAEGNKTNNSATDTDTIPAAGQVDLEVKKSVHPTSPLEGELITYTLVVTNNGPGTATGVKLTDAIPGGLTFASSVFPSGQSYNSTTGLWTIGSLANDASTTLKIIARINLDTDSDTIANTASGLTCDNGDYDLSNNTSNTVSFVVGKAPDLQIRKTDYQTSLSPSDEFTYTIFITNAGSADATGIVITDVLPNYLSYVTDTLQTLGITYTNPTAKTYRWDLPSTSYKIEAGEVFTFELGVEAASSMTGSALVNNVKVSTESDEGNKTNNSASDSDAITYSPSISFSKSASPTEQKLNSSITFYIYVTNNSSVGISSVVVKDTFSTTYLDVTGISTTKGSASYNSSSNATTTNIGTLNANTSATITISCKVINASTSIAYLTNYAYLTYTYSGNSFSKTASAAYRISSSSSGSTLPTTGGSEVTLMDSQSSGMTMGVILAIISSAFLFISGIVLFVLWRWFAAKQSDWAGWCLRMGSVVLVVAVGFAFAAWGLSGITNQQPVAQAPEPTQETVVQQKITDLRPVDIPIAEDELEFLPNFPVPTPSFAPTVQNTEQPVDDSSPVRLLIPDLAVDTVIKYVPYDGSTWLISGLKQEVAWLGNTSWPGLGGNTGLAGHVTLNTGENGPFRFLDQLNTGSVITLFTEKNIYNYKVRESKVVDSSQVSVLDQTTKPSLTLITCTNWDKTLGYYVNRYIIFADLDTTVPIASSVSGN